MPLLFHKKISPCGELGIWETQEDEDFFRGKMQLTGEEEYHFGLMKENRRVEWLAGRWLLHVMSGRSTRGNCWKDDSGKPWLEGSPFKISISHSHKLVAVAAAPCAVGVDIQLIVEKLERIAPKYMTKSDMRMLDPHYRLEKLHVYWGAKESLFKAYGKGQLDFKKHLHVSPFQFDPAGGELRARIEKPDVSLEFQLRYEQLDNYMVVYALQTLTGKK